MAKKYYWLKLKDDFFEQKEIKMLRRIAGGDTYTIIYLKMLLISLKEEGKLYFDGVATNFSEEIALEIDEDVENVQVTLNYLKSKNLLELIEEDELILSDLASMIGSETDAAVRKRRQRAKLKRDDVTESRDDVTPMSQLGHTEIEIEKEKEKELEIEIDTELENRFQELWEIYPKKQDKALSYHHYTKAVEGGTSDDEIRNGIENYKTILKHEKTEFKFIKMDRNFFKEKAWENYQKLPEVLANKDEDDMSWLDTDNLFKGYGD